MEAVIHLDTHVVVWLYAGDLKRLAPARGWLEHHALMISPMVKLELAYLQEIGRLKNSAEEIIADLVDRVGLTVTGVSFADAVSHAAHLVWTRDPFDRLIVGSAMAEGLPLLTADQSIQRHFSQAVWKTTRLPRPTARHR